MRKLRCVIGALLALILTACLTLGSAPPSQLPLLHLSPRAFNSNVSLAQRLTLVAANNALIQKLGDSHSLDSFLEINTQEVRMAGFAVGRRLLTLHWDGQNLSASQDRLLPWRADPERILRDIQLAFWPAATIIAVLPAGWTLEDGAASRTLQQDGITKVHINYNGTPRWQGITTIDNRAEGYLLTIESSAQE